MTSLPRGIAAATVCALLIASPWPVPAARAFYTSLGYEEIGLLRDLLPAYARAGKRYLTIAIGCTGGRHRSVHTAKKLAETLENGPWRVALRHRDIHLGHE